MPSLDGPAGWAQRDRVGMDLWGSWVEVWLWGLLGLWPYGVGWLLVGGIGEHSSMGLVRVWGDF